MKHAVKERRKRKETVKAPQGCRVEEKRKRRRKETVKATQGC